MSSFRLRTLGLAPKFIQLFGGSNVNSVLIADMSLSPEKDFQVLCLAKIIKAHFCLREVRNFA
jgi:hypothetical protein